MWFRSFFGVPSSITAPDGRPVNAVRGFFDAVATVITQQRPGRLVVCLDLDWRPQWRVDLIPSYKAHRVEEETTARRTRRRGGARRPHAAGRHDHGAARRVRGRHRRRTGFRGRRRPGHTRRAGAARSRGRRQRGSRPAAGGDRRSGAGAGALPGPRPGQSDAVGPAEVAERYGLPPNAPAPPTPNWLCCAAIRPTDYPAWRLGEKTAAGLLSRTARSTTFSPPPGPEIKCGQRHSGQARRGGRLSGSRGTVVRVATDAPVTLSKPTDACRFRGRNPKLVAELAESVRRGLVDRPAAEGVGLTGLTQG